MTEKKQWKRPQDVVTFRTSDPKEMLGKYLPKHALKTWTEDFRDVLSPLWQPTTNRVPCELAQTWPRCEGGRPTGQGGGYKAGVEIRLAA